MLPGTVNAFPSRGIAREGFRSRAGADAGQGDTSSGNSARLKDACMGSELTTFFYTRKDRIFFNRRTIVADFKFENDFYFRILWIFGSVRVARISSEIKRDFEFQKSTFIIERRMGIFSKIRGIG